MSALRATAPNPERQRYEADSGAWTGPSLDARLTHSAQDHSGPLVVDELGHCFDSAALDERIARLAGGLRARGIRSGDAVAWQMTNRAEALLCYRACWRVGAVAAPVHHRASAREAAASLAGVQPALVFVEPGLALEEHRDCVLLDSSAWEAMAAAEPVHDLRAPGGELGAALATSGSSGTSKVVLHDTRALAYKAAQMVMVHGLTQADAVLMPAPLAHVSGLLNGILVPQATPCRTVLMARWDPDRALDIIEGEHITFMVGPPTFFVALMGAASFSSERVASLRLVSSGGAGVTAAFCRRASEGLGARIKRTYGSTEAPTVATSEADDASHFAHHHDGRALGDVELRIVEPGGDDPLPAGHVGELLIRGPEVSVGYTDTDATKRAFTPDGWFRSGDLASLADDWLSVAGRLDDVVIRGGENISAAEVQAVLEAHPSVREAVVVGFPDELMGERLCAFVTTDEVFDLAASSRWCSQQDLSRHKHPEQVVTLPELPTLASGKPDKARLRDEASRRFSAG